MIHVYAPKLQPRSNGICILYELAYQLINLGAECQIVCHEPLGASHIGNDRITSRYQNIPIVELGVGFTKKQVRPSDVVIYSEVVPDNPLEARRVVRYLMNVPGVLIPDSIAFSPSDLVISYSYRVDDQLPQVFLLIPATVHVPDEEKDDQVLIHFGKTNEKQLNELVEKTLSTIRKFRNVVIVTRHHPLQREVLERWIIRSKIVISFDPLSNLHYESTLLGTPVLIADESLTPPSTKFNIPLPGISYIGKAVTDWNSHEAGQLHLRYIEEGNPAACRTLLNLIETHFSLMEASAVLRDQNLAKIQARASIWEAIAKTKLKAQLSNIDSVKEIPERILRKIDYKSFRQQRWRRVYDQSAIKAFLVSTPVVRSIYWWAKWPLRVLGRMK